jgi:hypothetical protein
MDALSETFQMWWEERSDEERERLDKVFPKTSDLLQLMEVSRDVSNQCQMTVYHTWKTILEKWPHDEPREDTLFWELMFEMMRDILRHMSWIGREMHRIRMENVAMMILSGLEPLEVITCD